MAKFGCAVMILCVGLLKSCDYGTAQLVNPIGAFKIYSCPPSNLFVNQTTRVATWNQPIVSSYEGNIVSTTQSQNSSSAFQEGQTVVTYTWTDAYNNQAICYFPVVVNSNIISIAGCPPSVTIDQVTRIASWVDPFVTSSTTVTISGPNVPSGSTFKFGTTEVTYSYCDANFNMANCEFTVTVNPSSASEPTSVEVTDNTDQCVVTWDVPDEPNGKIQGYNVYFTTGPLTDFNQKVGAPNDEGSFKDIRGMQYVAPKNKLEIDTRYGFEVTASTPAGEGPKANASGFCYTDSGAQTGSPVGIVVGVVVAIVSVIMAIIGVVKKRLRFTRYSNVESNVHSETGIDLDDIGEVREGVVRLKDKDVKDHKDTTDTLEVAMEHVLSYENLIIDQQQLLGKGACGAVSSVKFDFADGSDEYKEFKEAAAKLVPKEYISEAHKMQIFDHPNIVRLLGIVDAPRAPGDVERLFIIMEKGEMSLLDCLQKRPEDLTRPIQGKIALAICEGLKYVHDKNIVHRDIKPENIILFPGNVPKLTDFGISEAAIATKISIQGRGTALFRAPELDIKGSFHPKVEKGEFSKASDIYSLGLVLWQLFSKRDIPVPLPPKIPENFPESLKVMLPNTWQTDRHKRPHIEEIISTLKNDNFGV